MLADRHLSDTTASPPPYTPFSPPASHDASDDEPNTTHPTSSRSSSSSPANSDSAYNKVSLITVLGAGRLDPFQVYCKKDLPIYVHGVLDHMLQHVASSFSLAEKPAALSAVKDYVMSHAMTDPLTWYTIILSGITHHMFAHGEGAMSKEQVMLRLSYKTQAIVEIRSEIQRQNGQVSEAVLFAINTLAAHGGGNFDKPIKTDRIQESKAFGKANAVNYYSTIDIEWEHWNTMTRLVRQRGGPQTMTGSSVIAGYPPSPGPGCLTATDVLIAWRSLKCPEFALVVSTDKVTNLQRLTRDMHATTLSQKMLSGFPAFPKNIMHARRLTNLLQKIRTLLVDFDQHQRDVAPDLDLRLLYWTRLMLLHDLLLLPDLETSDNPMDLIYEVVRNCLLAFNQLVLTPVVASNRMPEKILAQLLPVLRRCITSIHGRTLDREHPSLFLWAVMLSGMLAMEHYQSWADSGLLDEVSIFFERVPFKAEKSSWPMAAGVLKNFLWLESECDGPGSRYWNYACLWVAERKHSGEGAEESE